MSMEDEGETYKVQLTLYVVLFQVNSLQHWDEISTTLPCSILCPSQNIPSGQGDRNALLLKRT